MKRIVFFIGIVSNLLFLTTAARDITFCGERIPVENSFVAKKLMSVIKQQIPYANLPSLRRDAKRYFPMIEYMLRKSNMPDDLKYIPIVESGFKNATSKAGAQGFWQLMPATATDWGLIVNASMDERNDIYKSTIAAMRELARTFKAIKRDYRISSWVMTAAAYNYGIGRLYDKIKAGSNNYFSMQLNPETAVYVYKIIAIKELFEFPELYIKNFQQNYFNPKVVAQDAQPEKIIEDQAAFSKLTYTAKVDANTGPEDAAIKSIQKPTEKELRNQKNEKFRKAAKLISAQIIGKYPEFKDGDAIQIKLQDDLQTLNGYQREGSIIQGKGWVVDDRVFIDLGFDTDNVILYDKESEQGIPLKSLKNKEPVVLRVQN
ncbi:lytic transglycosylase domain-containing protein [Flavisolibacter sp. BT320]|nr:lytic transglycosylase domain-containing protein [Flavisolibacter longurius]